MKLQFRKILLLLFAVVSLSGVALSEALPGIHENIAIAIRTGNSKQLASYFSNTVEITIPGKEGTFSKVQAEMIMKDFFSKTIPTTFTIDQKGNSAGGAQFMIGTYKSNNTLFKTYILLKPVENQMLIQQIQFEED